MVVLRVRTSANCMAKSRSREDLRLPGIQGDGRTFLAQSALQDVCPVDSAQTGDMEPNVIGIQAVR
jgi:hypothetical protein